MYIFNIFLIIIFLYLISILGNKKLNFIFHRYNSEMDNNTQVSHSQLKAEDYTCFICQEIENMIISELESINAIGNFEHSYRINSYFKQIPEKLKTHKVCLTAVSIYGPALEHVPVAKRTDQICEIAVKEDSSALEFVPESKKTYKLCLMAVSKNGSNIRFVPESMRNDELYDIAVSENGYALKFIPNNERTVERCAIGAMNNFYAFQDIPEEYQYEVRRKIREMQNNPNSKQYKYTYIFPKGPADEYLVKRNI